MLAVLPAISPKSKCPSTARPVLTLDSLTSSSTSPSNSPSASIHTTSPRKSRKHVFTKPESLRAPLRITIPPPQLNPVRAGMSHPGSPTLSNSDLGLDGLDDLDSYSGSETSSEDPAEPTTPRMNVNLFSPQSPGSISKPGCIASPRSSYSQVVDDLGLGSLRLSGRSPTSSFASPRSPPCSPRKSMSVRNAAFASLVPRSSTRVGPFQFLRILSGGSYGTAYAACDLPSGNVYCAKVCRKVSILSRSERLRGLTSELLAYKRIATASETSKKWLMELHGVVQDPHNVVFVMDLMQTDLFSFLESPVKNSSTVRWIAQIALGIDALHGLGIIHRDIKPENILIVPGTGSARIRITDFTNAWLAPGDVPEEWQQNYDVEPGAPLLNWRTYSKKYIGTPEYTAPEMRHEEWYGPMVDWWSLGCLVFDLLVGDVLFPDYRTLRIFMEWQRCAKKLSDYFPLRVSYMTESETDLLGGLLTVDPGSRYCLRQLRKHPYFINPKTRQSIFDEMDALPLAPPKKTLTRADFDIDCTLRNLSICYATAELDSSASHASHGSSSDYDDFAWINPYGIWGTKENL